MMSFDLIANIVVAILLIATIGFAYMLNRRLQAMKDEQEVMARLISGLNLATSKAQEGIHELRAVAQSTEDTLRKQITEARALADELQMITEAGNNLASKIEAGLTRKPQDVPAPRVNQTRSPPFAEKGARAEGRTAGRTSWVEEDEEKDVDFGNTLRTIR